MRIEQWQSVAQLKTVFALMQRQYFTGTPATFTEALPCLKRVRTFALMVEDLPKDKADETGGFVGVFLLGRDTPLLSEGVDERQAGADTDVDVDVDVDVDAVELDVRTDAQGHEEPQLVPQPQLDQASPVFIDAVCVDFMRSRWLTKRVLRFILKEVFLEMKAPFLFAQSTQKNAIKALIRAGFVAYVCPDSGDILYILSRKKAFLRFPTLLAEKCTA